MKELLYQRNLIALESSVAGNLSEYFATRIPGIVASFNETVRGFFSDTGEDVKLTALQKEFIQNLSKHNYMNLSGLTVFVPEGLAVSYNDYLESLREMTNFVLTVPEELEHFHAFLARLVSDENSQMSSDYVKDKLKSIADGLDEIVESNKKCFSKTTHTEVKYKEVLRNNGEWNSIFSRLNGINDDMNKLRKMKLQERVNKSSDLMDILIAKSKRGELSNISPEMLNKLGDYVYLVAKSLELYSITQYRSIALTNSINRSVEKLNEWMSH